MAEHVASKLLAALTAAMAAAPAGCRQAPSDPPAQVQDSATVASSKGGGAAVLRIRVCPLGEVEQQTVKAAAEALRQVLGGEVRLGDALTLPQRAYDAARGQYRSDVVLDGLAREASAMTDADKLLAVADVDMYTPGLNFVLGQARMRGRAALMTTARLDPQFFGGKPNAKLLKARIEKEAVHEVGHAIGLEHCRDRRCVMHFSNTIADTDYKRRDPCAECRERIRSLLRTR